MVFNLLYLSPQIFSLLSINALFYSNWFLLFLLFLLPVPSPGRAWLEFRGYKMSMAVWYWTTGITPDINFVVKQFTNSSYYWMWPFKRSLERKLQREIANLKEGNISGELLKVRNILLEE